MGRYRDDAILVDFGEGAYGSTILIDVQTAKALSRLLELFTDLARADRKSIDLLRLEGLFRSSAVESLVLRTSVDESGINLASTGPAGHALMWSEPKDQWAYCTEQLATLLAGQLPGHQYLTEEGSPVLVVVQFQE